MVGIESVGVRSAAVLGRRTVCARIGSEGQLYSTRTFVKQPDGWNRNNLIWVVVLQAERLCVFNLRELIRFSERKRLGLISNQFFQHATLRGGSSSLGWF